MSSSAAIFALSTLFALIVGLFGIYFFLQGSNIGGTTSSPEEAGLGVVLFVAAIGIEAVGVYVASRSD